MTFLEFQDMLSRTLFDKLNFQSQEHHVNTHFHMWGDSFDAWYSATCCPMPPTAAQVGLNLPPAWRRDYALVYAQMNTWVTSSSVPNNDKHLGNYKNNLTCLAHLLAHINAKTSCSPLLLSFFCKLTVKPVIDSLFIFHSFFYTPQPSRPPHLSLCVLNLHL